MADRPHAFPEDLKAGRISSLIEHLQSHNLKVSNLNSRKVSVLGDGFSPSWIDEDWHARENRISYTLDCMRLAAALGIPHVSIAPGGPIPASMNKKEAWRLFIASMHRVLPLSQKLGVKLLVQPEPGLVIENSDEMLAFIKELDDHNQLGHNQLGVDFDAGHFFCAMEDPCEAWEKLKPYVGHVHIEDIAESHAIRHLQLGEGVMDIPGFLHYIGDSGYTGFVTIGLDDYEQRAEDVVQASSRYMREKGFLHKKLGEC
jgi:sugar phosphate isomerase/epimerase